MAKQGEGIRKLIPFRYQRGGMPKFLLSGAVYKNKVIYKIIGGKIIKVLHISMEQEKFPPNKKEEEKEDELGRDSWLENPDEEKKDKDDNKKQPPAIYNPAITSE